MTIHRSVFTTLWLVPLMAAVALGGCLTPDDSSPADEDDNLSFASLALTDDDEADDGFDEDMDPAPFLDELDEDGAFEGDSAPTADEDDPAETEDVAEVDLPEAELVRRTIRVVWGQPKLNLEIEEPFEWKGQIKTSNGIVRVLRKIRFEPEYDHLVADGDPRTVTFKTYTKPHNDGLLLRVVVPKAAIAGATITFATTAFAETLPLAELLDGFHQMVKVDATGNFVRVDTLPAHPCAHGFLRAHWKRINARGGVFGGAILDDAGELTGYWVGLWGTVGGKRRFKGVVLTPEKTFDGTIRGAYHPFPAALGIDGGTFRGHWRIKGGAVKGVLGGLYGIAEDGGRGGLAGLWRARCAGADKVCDGELELPTDAPVCGCPEGADDEGCGCEMPPMETCLDEPADS